MTTATMPQKKLYIVGVTPLTLLIHRCRRCGDLMPLGFWQQLKVEVDRPGKRARVDVVCEVCGARAKKTYRLTTGNPVRYRWCRWVEWGWKVLPLTNRLPWAWQRRLMGLILWLESRVRF